MAKKEMETFIYFDDIDIYCYHLNLPGWTSFNVGTGIEMEDDEDVREVICPDCGQVYRVTLKIEAVDG